MLTILFLSADSVFAGAAIRFFPSTRKYLRLACIAMGLGDATALLLGYLLRSVIASSITAHSDQLLVVSGALAAIAIAQAGTKFPRAAILGTAVLLSFDSLLAGAQMSSTSFVLNAVGLVWICSGLATFAGFQCANALAPHLKPKAAFLFACISLVVCVLVR
jgi:hypothetical protein